MSWFRKKDRPPKCEHSGHWVYVSIRHLVNRHFATTVTEYTRACKACDWVDTGLWEGTWTREFLESDLGQKAMPTHE